MLGVMHRPSIGLAVACLLAAGCGPGTMPASIGHSMVGNAAPEFSESSTGEADVSVPGGPLTKVTVVDFWASWCETCKQSMPMLDELYRDKREKGVMVIGVSVDQVRDDAIAAANQLHATFPIVHDPGMRVASRYRVANVPITFVIDRRGTVRWIGRDPGEAKRAVNVLLDE
jgi:cytochrome c biogenesis protein CcmG, thiol:disulfide interchange protein DsbE